MPMLPSAGLNDIGIMIVTVVALHSTQHKHVRATGTTQQCLSKL